MANRSIEPLLWLLFSAGGALAALLIPSLLLLFGLAFPLGWLTPPSYEHLVALLRHPLARVGLLSLCVLSLFHWTHRFKYTLYDSLQIQHLKGIVNLLCYGAALIGCAAAGYLLWQL